MTASHALSSFRRRPAFTAATLVVSLAALGLFVGGLPGGGLPAAEPSATVPLALPAPQPVRLGDTMPMSGLPAPLETAARPVAEPAAAAAPEPAIAPSDSAIVEPVDPAEALFGDQALVGVAN